MTRRKSPHDLDTFHAHLDALKLFFIREHYPDVVRRAAEEQSDHLTVLERLIEGEANLRRDRSIERRIRLARFPVKKTLDSFDWSWPNKINRLQVQNLFRLRFLDDNANVVLVGGVGLGKSHLVTVVSCKRFARGPDRPRRRAVHHLTKIWTPSSQGRRTARERDSATLPPTATAHPRRTRCPAGHQPTLRTRLDCDHHQSRVQALARDPSHGATLLRHPRPPAPPCRDAHFEGSCPNPGRVAAALVCVLTPTSSNRPI